MDAGISPGTINRDLALVRRILNLSARLWRDESDQPWLYTPPLIQMQRDPNKREPYPLSIDEQRLLFSELAGHLSKMALFKVNTGLREAEVVNLRWQAARRRASNRYASEFGSSCADRSLGEGMRAGVTQNSQAWA